MSGFVVCEGATLLAPTNSNNKHLFVVLNDPLPGTGQVLMVSIITNRQGQGYLQDTTCALMKGDHPFICHDSLVDYKRARLVTAQQLENGVVQGYFFDKGPIDGGILLNICDGLLDSPYAKPEHKTFYSSTQ